MRLPRTATFAATAILVSCSSIDTSGGLGGIGPDGGTAEVTLEIQASDGGAVRGAGSDCRGRCRVTMSTGSKLHLTAVADSGSRFTGWGGACSGTADCDLTLSANQSVTATFAAIPASSYPLTVNVTGQGRITSSPAGIDCPGASCSASFTSGSQVQLKAAASSGWQLSTWSGACNGASSCALTMNGPASVDARFTEIPPPPPPPPPPPDECAGLGPQPVTPVDYALDPMEQSCQAGVGDSHGMLLFTSRRTDDPKWGTMQLFAWPDQTVSRGQFYDNSMRPYSEPEGLAALLTSHSQGYVWAIRFGDDGLPGNNGGPLQHPGTPWPAADPTGGLMVAGDLAPVAPGYAPTPSLFSYTTSSGSSTLRRWQSPLSSRGPVFGIGVDVKGNTLVVTGGGPAFGQGTISAEWFDAAGKGSGEFKLFGDFTPGASTWFQLMPLIGGGLAVARFDGTGAHDMTSSWIGVVQSMSHTMDAAPGWLSSRGNAWLEIVRGGKAYAFLPLGGANVACAPEIEVVSPGGKSCGTHALFLASGKCDTFDVTAGKDGTLMVELPQSMERSSGAVRSCTWRAWRAELR